MLTLFACPKPFKQHIGLIQRNAITSWSKLSPKPEVILSGNEEGTAELCEELGLTHVPEVASNEFGTPLISDMFKRVEQMSTSDFLCHLNADMILMSDFMKAVQRVVCLKRPFLLCGHRWNLDVREPMRFKGNWEASLRADVAKRGRIGSSFAIDYFVFPRGFVKEMPAFAVGRGWSDHWLLAYARTKGALLIDATAVIQAVHQKHDYGHVSAAVWDEVAKSPESIRSLELAGGPRKRYTLEDANHRLTPTRLRFSWGGALRISRRRSLLLEQWSLQVWYPLLAWTRPLRHRLGLRKEMFRRQRERCP